MATFLKFTKPQHTANNILYLLLAFPLGLIYFIVTIVGLAVGTATTIIWVGIPILFLTFVALWGIAAVERSLARSLLHMDLPPAPRIRPANGSWRAQMRARITHPLVWKSLIYVWAKFLLGIFSFTLAIVLPVASLALLLEPLWYVVSTYIMGTTHMCAGVALICNGHPEQAKMLFFDIPITGQFDPSMFLRAFLGVPCGFASWYISMAILAILAHAWGDLVRVLLCASAEELATPVDPFAETATPRIQVQYAD